jgi:hypothetical protein
LLMRSSDLSHSCVIQVFIAVARRGDARLITARLGSALRKHRFVYCWVIVGTCFDVTVFAWRKYVTILLILKGSDNGVYYSELLDFRILSIIWCSRN